MTQTLVGILLALFVLVAALPLAHTTAQPLDQFIQPGRGFGVHGCSLGFVLTDPLGRDYITTDGHCITSPFLSHPVYGTWGHVEAVSYTSPGEWPASDIALVSVLPGYENRVNATVHLTGGPIGIAASGSLPAGRVLLYKGAPGLGQVATTIVIPARPVMVETHNETEMIAYAAAFPLGGESGSPIVDLETRQAVGLLKGAPPMPELADRLVRVRSINLDDEIARLEAITALDLTLVNGALLPTG